MRDEAEVQHTHDVLVAALEDAERLALTEPVAAGVAVALAALCWVLDDAHERVEQPFDLTVAEVEEIVALVTMPLPPH